MGTAPRYKRVLVKLSGESFCRPEGFGIEADAVAGVVDEIRPLSEMGVQAALVVGGGNLVRGRDLTDNPEIQPVTGDYMGMLGTVINALALQDAMEARRLPARVMSAIPMAGVCESYIRPRAIRHLEKGRMVILAAGTGSPFFTTDTCASLRAAELNAEVLLKGTKVDGVFDSDPVTNPAAKRYDRLTYQRVLADRLGVMDLTAVAMCMKHKIPIIVFQLSENGTLARIVRGEDAGTLVSD
jgi:uridylate kinase